VRHFLRGKADPNAVHPYPTRNNHRWHSFHGAPRLHIYTELGKLKSMRALLEAKADVNGRNAFLQTPLHICTKPNFKELSARRARLCSPTQPPIEDYANLLIQAEADPNLDDENGETPLFMNAWHGCLDVVQLLLAAKASPNKPNMWGKTPLHMCALEGHVDVVRALLEANASPHAVNDDGETPLYLMWKHWSVKKKKEFSAMGVATSMTLNLWDRQRVQPRPGINKGRKKKICC